MITEIEKATIEVKLVIAALKNINDQLEALLYDVRHNNGLCTECGRPVNKDIPNAEYCDTCFDESKAIHDHIFRDLEQDNRIS